MLATCANLSCSASFRHLADGRLFRLETEARFASPKSRETEYFWLCEACSAGTTLRLTLDGRVVPTELSSLLCNGPYVALNAVDREHGAFLRSISFLPRSHPKGT
ncbi:MAG: hypothetical protein LAP86_18025 [Acidobacteriia bacterium]|nr:hypothetical protein [Terriglobia bacterium]